MNACDLSLQSTSYFSLPETKSIVVRIGHVLVNVKIATSENLLLAEPVKSLDCNLSVMIEPVSMSHHGEKKRGKPRITPKHQSHNPLQSTA